jgi:subtilase family serine protease
LAGGVAFVTASGDNGAGTSYPAASPNVISVGGTTLTTNANGDYLGEVAWSGSGGGTSSIEGTAIPTVAYDANPSTGFSVYDSTPNGSATGWQVFGGTSVGAPQWAALIADIDQGLAYLGQGSLTGTAAIAALKALPAGAFHDIVSGSNGGSSAGSGSDLVTGLGTPDVPNLIEDIVGTRIASTIAEPEIAAHTAIATASTSTASSKFSSNLVDALGMVSATDIL